MTDRPIELAAKLAPFITDEKSGGLPSSSSSSLSLLSPLKVHIRRYTYVASYFIYELVKAAAVAILDRPMDRNQTI